MAIYRTNLKSNPIRRIEAELGPGELLLWTGAPVLVFRFPHVKGASHASCLGIIGALFIWAIFAFATLGVVEHFLSGGLSTVIAFFGVIFIWQLIRMWTVNPIQRANRYYAITNRRAMIVAGRGRRTLRSLAFEAMEFLTFRRDRTGVGSIDCFVPGHPDCDRDDDESSEHYPGPHFGYIADAEAAIALLRRLLKNEQSS